MLVQNSCRPHAHMMHTSNATKMTNHHDMISSSIKHFIALLHKCFGHQDELKQACHNGMKWRASHNEHFDISCASNGASHIELWHDEHANLL